jgi:hypothetical protein
MALCITLAVRFAMTGPRLRAKVIIKGGKRRPATAFFVSILASYQSDEVGMLVAAILWRWQGPWRRCRHRQQYHENTANCVRGMPMTSPVLLAQNSTVDAQIYETLAILKTIISSTAFIPVCLTE